MNKEQIWHKLNKSAKKAAKKIRKCNRDKKNKTKMKKVNKILESEDKKNREVWILYLRLKSEDEKQETI